jgi:alkanesulfonate monooxygenase SsuD/methylene tetrahydromethanopterin reductase-like flavin-dependent oxidoreductase (luciferase family)
MQFGASIFFTDYSISPAQLAVALEERGFDSLWAAEHSHIPVPRRTPAPGGGELAKRYYDVMDPFVTLTAAAAATKELKLATGICLVIQRDTIQTAKLVASIESRAGVSCSASAAAGTPKRSKITGPSSQAASRRCASRSRR